MEIRKPGAAELKPALALAWDVFLKDAASGFSDEGIRTFKRLHRIRRHGDNAGQRDNDDVGRVFRP